MISISKIMIFIGLPLLCGYSVSAQQATAAAAATVVTPIAIAKIADLNFGNIAVSASNGGTVSLSPTGGRSLSGSGVTLPAATGVVAAAAFLVSGAPSYSYAITLPTSCTISDGSGHTMNVNSIASYPAGTGTLSGSGSASLQVSASLVVSAAQVAGVYTNASALPVTVNYN